MWRGGAIRLIAMSCPCESPRCAKKQGFGGHEPKAAILDLHREAGVGMVNFPSLVGGQNCHQRFGKVAERKVVVGEQPGHFDYLPAVRKVVLQRVQVCVRRDRLAASADSIEKMDNP
jgi:hypothetical protein